MTGLLSVFEAKRELAATQLSLAVNGDTSMGLDINEMLVYCDALIH